MHDTKTPDHIVNRIPPCLDITEQLQVIKGFSLQHIALSLSEPPLLIAGLDHGGEGISSLTRAPYNMHNVSTSRYGVTLYCVFA